MFKKASWFVVHVIMLPFHGEKRKNGNQTSTTSQTKKKAPHTTKQKQNITEWNGYPNAAMKRNDKAAYVPRPEQVILEATAQRQT